MKRNIKRILYGLMALMAVVCIGTFTYTYARFNYYTTDDSPYKIQASVLEYYQTSYAKCRQAFRAQAHALSRIRNGVETFSILVKGRQDTDLTIDGCYIPAPQKKEKLLIFSSGVHGVEGFVGSAVQCMFMAEFLQKADFGNVGFLLLHGLNPWGFKNLRRVTENNVDLNRNCEIDSLLFKTRNEGYTALYDLINPQGKTDTGSVHNRLFHLLAVKEIAMASMRVLRQAILQGQYQHAKGLFFGGQAFEPQLSRVRSLLIEIAAPYAAVLNIDLHTGYGARGVLHLFPNPIDDPQIRRSLETIFAGYRIDWGDTEDYYTVTGEFSSFIGKALKRSKYLPMVFEYGTMDSQTTLGAIKSLHVMILENQGFHYGYATKEDETKIKHDLMEMYYPSSEAWRSEVIVKTRDVLKNVLPRLAAWDVTSE